MPQVVETTVYNYSELSEDAKETARYWWANLESDMDFDPIYMVEDFQKIAEIIGFEFDSKIVNIYGGGTREEPKINWSDFYSQGAGLSFDGWYSYKKDSLKKIKEYAPQDKNLCEIVQKLLDIQKKNFYALEATISQKPFAGFKIYRSDDKEVSEEIEESLKDCITDFSDWMYSQLKNEYDFQTSPETIGENLDINGYLFDKEGNFVK